MSNGALNDLGKVLVIIPARGGSKGIPRKNMRGLGGRPLIHYALDLALSIKLTHIDVCLSSEDSEIIQQANDLPVIIHPRPLELGDDQTTIDNVVMEVVTFCESTKKAKYDVVITIQPTSPFLSKLSIYNCLEALMESGVQTVLTVREEKHLSWSLREGHFYPDYKKRINRQWISSTYVETGGCVACWRDLLEEGSRFGDEVRAVILDFPESIDIDSRADWALAEHVLSCRRIAIWLIGNAKVGLGHVANMLILAADLAEHEIEFFCEPSELLAIKKIQQNNYSITVSEDPLAALEAWAPDIVVNDRLNTTEPEILKQKELGARVVNFEDMGPGRLVADYVINAIYKMDDAERNTFFGADYYLLRDEFMSGVTTARADGIIKKVLITFGGTDPNNLTEKVLLAITDFCLEKNIEVTVVLGLGAQDVRCEIIASNVEIIRNTASMAAHMAQADIAFSSAGRTIYELAAVQLPSIILCQNDREQSHFFASDEFGFVNLGLGVESGLDKILFVFKSLTENVEARRIMQDRMAGIDVSGGRRKIRGLLKAISADVF